MAPSDHLLRTLASVAPGARVVDVACGEGRHLDPLARLGFDVWGATDGDPAPARRALAAVLGDAEAERRVSHAAPDALGAPDAWADWMVVSGLDAARLGPALAEAARVLKPGAWVWVEGPAAAALREAATAAGLADAEAPAGDDGAVHAIFRRPGAVG